MGFAPAAASEDAEMAASGPEPPEKKTRTVGSLELEAFVECGMMYEGLDKQDHMALEAFIGAVVAGPAAAAAGQPDLVAESVVYDARSGEELDLDLVRVGRLGELDQMAKHQVYREVPAAQAWGRRVKARWVDEYRRKDGNTEVRSRLVAMEFNLYVRDDVNASTPPLAAIRAVISMAASKSGTRFLAVYDVSVAFFHATIDEDITVLPPPGAGRPGHVWILLKAMYGTRRAAQLWQEHLAGVFKSGNWRRIGNIAGAYYEPNLDIALVIHGDDFLAEGTAECLNELDKLLFSAMDVKAMPRIGPGAASSGKYLKRIIKWENDEFTWEADPKHVARTIEILNLADAKPADTPGTKTTGASMRDALDPLVGGDLATYPSICGLLNYLATDRPDIQYSVKCILVDMKGPTKLSLLRCKRIGRYLKGKPVLLWRFPKQKLPTRVVYQTDSDWAECKETRKSTTCIFGFFGSHLLETQVAGQSLIALSSGEAEFYAIGRGSASALMMKYFLEQVGIEVVAVIQSDSSAARGIASRIGCGKLRHLHIRDLWIQEKVRSGELVLERALTEDNTSDLGTKHIDGRRIEKLVGLAGMKFQGSVAGQAGLKGLAVATLLLGRAAATTAMEIRKENDGDTEQANYMSLSLLVLGVFTFGSCCTLLVLCSCWCWCRGRFAQPAPKRRKQTGMREAAAQAAPGSRVAAAAAPMARASAATEPTDTATAAAAASAVGGAGSGGGARRATTRRHVQTNTVAEELAQYSVAVLKLELKAKGLLVGGLKDDLVRRLRPAMASDEMYRVACRVSEARNAAIPLESLRSDVGLRGWIEHGLERWQQAT